MPVPDRLHEPGGSVRISAPSSVMAMVCSLWAVRQPVALRRVRPSASTTRRPSHVGGEDEPTAVTETHHGASGRHTTHGRRLIESGDCHVGRGTGLGTS